MCQKAGLPKSGYLWTSPYKITKIFATGLAKIGNVTMWIYKLCLLLQTFMTCNIVPTYYDLLCFLTVPKRESIDCSIRVSQFYFCSVITNLEILNQVILHGLKHEMLQTHTFSILIKSSLLCWHYYA